MQEFLVVQDHVDQLENLDIPEILEFVDHLEILERLLILKNRK